MRQGCFHNKSSMRPARNIKEITEAESFSNITSRRVLIKGDFKYFTSK